LIKQSIGASIGFIATAGKVSVVVVLMDGLEDLCDINDFGVLLKSVPDHPVVVSGAADTEWRYVAIKIFGEEEVVEREGASRCSLG
jgi:hypothetical protein